MRRHCGGCTDTDLAHVGKHATRLHQHGHAADALAPGDMATVLYGRLSDLPAFNPDVDETVPEAVTDLRGQLATAEHVEELTALAGLLSRLELRVFDAVTAEVATSLAATHRLPAADAVHLATAVVAGADRFVTNNLRDVPDTLTDIDVTYPDMLSDRLPYVTRQNPVSQCGKPFPVQRR